MKQPLDFQSIILAFQHFWAEHGCLVWQPYYSQVGAGTYNPATFLRVLGPEPWNVVYVEPSIRPDDARYGENPNRMQMHYQLQVILKPDPGNPQELYLKSLEAVGIDPRQHDIRFVEDNWESPALGAWGLGWEVWLDGQEITQYTYFQQAGGQLLDPVSVELTYGLDRIAIALQRVHGFTDIRWNERFTAGDVNLQAEQEHSRYYFEIADVERVRQMYDLFEAEANACLAQKLVLPAYDYVLKCSHTFNVLDTRGAIGVTDRQAFFGRMRDLSRRVSEAYLEQRQRLEFPWLDDGAGQEKSTGQREAAQSSSLTSGNAPFLLEIGTEELPAGDLDSALEQLNRQTNALLETLRLEHGEVRVLGTPRRLVVYMEALAPRQSDLEQLVKGPPADRAFDSAGKATKAGEGFARSKGIDVSALEVQEMDGGRYVTALVRQEGRPAVEVLSVALPGLIASIRFDKSMRWNASNVGFSRPIRWLLALYGEQVVPFAYAGLASGRLSRGLRFNSPFDFQVHSPADYFIKLNEQEIVLDVQERKDRILEQVKTLAAGVNGQIAEDPGLLAEVANLVESPNALIGSFDEAHLQLPRDVLVSVMKKHQRYFPVLAGAKPTGSGSQKKEESEDGSLLPYFIAVRNGDGRGTDIVREGNEHVIQARFADAAFFVKEDLKQPLESYLEHLGTLTFQAKLGSMLDKTRRITGLVVPIGEMAGLNGKEMDVARRAALLCKADLVTKMVVEMTSLQGIMGGYYALISGESESVAQAIFQHYLPRFSGDRSPSSRPGLAVGLADRLDTLTGLFAGGLAPTGAKDPFAQRRTALGLVQALLAQNLDFELKKAVDEAAARLPIPASSPVKQACLDFIQERLRNLLLEQGRRYDAVEAVLAAQGTNPARAARAVLDLEKWISRSDWHSILPAYARCVRITRDLKELFPVDPGVLKEPAENELFSSLQEAEAHTRRPGSVDDFLSVFTPLIPAINQFFDNVLVMAEDDRLRKNRLGLLQRIAALADGVVDLSKLEGF
jgi:glycyl-tRNA synthetase